MAPRNPAIVQSDAPQLLADLIKELTLIGPGVGLLGFSDQIAPVFIIGARGVVFEAQEPIFAPAEVFDDNGIGVTANAAIVDTGQLVAGNFDVIAQLTMINSDQQSQVFQLVQRNAGNTADVANWGSTMTKQGGIQTQTNTQTPLKFSMSVLEDERFIIRASVTDVSVVFAVWMMVRRRSDVT